MAKKGKTWFFKYELGEQRFRVYQLFANFKTNTNIAYNELASEAYEATQ